MLSHFFNLKGTLPVSVAMHLGSLGSLLYFYRHTLIAMVKNPRDREMIRSLKLYIMAIIPAGLFGLLFETWFQSFFENIKLLPLCFLISSVFLYSTRFKTPSITRLEYKHAIIIGFMQGLALLPGVSRSGITISTALLMGIVPRAGADFSFIISIPLIIGALLLESSSLLALGTDDCITIVFGIILSFLSGLLALHILYRMFKSSIPFHLFAYYCFFMALVSAAAIYIK